MRSFARTTLVAGLILALGGQAFGQAFGQSSSTAEQAERALDDPAALEELRSQSPQARRALSGTPEDVQVRLETLASDASSAGAEPISREELAEAVDDVYSQERFAEINPNSLRARWDRFRREMLLRLATWIDRLLGSVPGGPRLFFTLLAVAAVALLGLIAFRLARRRLRDVDRAELARRRASAGLDPRELRKLAEEAAARGDFEDAVRFLYQAGLVTLGERGQVELSTGTTSSEVAAQLQSRDFELVWHAFDAVTYGGRDAGADDVEAARRSWARVLEGS